MTTPHPKYRLAVFVSGSGTLLESMLDHDLAVSMAVADRECRGLKVADQHGVDSVLWDRTEYGWSEQAKWEDKPMSGEYSDKRRHYSTALASFLNDEGITLVAMAGFETVLSDEFFNTFKGLVLNSHPALLPSFKGGHAVRDALKFGAKVTGTTIHVATASVDDGTIIGQWAVEILPDDDESSLHERIKVVERKQYFEILDRMQREGIEAYLPDYQQPR